MVSRMYRHTPTHCPHSVTRARGRCHRHHLHCLLHSCIKYSLQTGMQRMLLNTLTRTARPCLLPVASSRRGSAQASTKSLKQPAGLSEVDKLTLSRRSVERRVGILKLNIAGVTFEGRQELVSQLRPMQPLLLFPEPSNPHDSAAVAVHTLSGGPNLGYVPRDWTDKFPPKKSGVYRGVVVSTGQAAGSGSWGAIIRALPDMALVPMPVPTSYKGSAAEQKVQQMCAEVSTSPNDTCEMTWSAGSEEAPLHKAPVWLLDPHAKTVKLLRVATLKQPLAQALQLLHMQQGQQADSAQATLLVRQYNSWQEDDFAAYLSWAQGMSKQMDTEGWTVQVD